VLSVSLWVDAVDFAQGGPLAPVSAGSFGFDAVSELGIDVATLGNHEFDWGEKHVARCGAETGFPLVVANYDIGLPHPPRLRRLQQHYSAPTR
jgi:2',3'-cyclic-nucleotide 2'-phosphodiesterase (5'-nucleotidase family)